MKFDSIDVVVPTFYGKKKYSFDVIKKNLHILKKYFDNINYYVVVDFYRDVDNRFDYWEQNKNIGVNLYFKYNISGHKESFKCINFGVKISKSKFVMIMDDDFYISDQYIEKSFDLLSSYEAVFLGSFLISDRRIPISMNPNDESLTIGSGQPKLFIRDFLLNNGLYDESYIGYMFCDNDFSRKYIDKNIVVIDGANLGVRTFDHKYYFEGKQKDQGYVHRVYYKHNLKKFCGE